MKAILALLVAFFATGAFAEDSVSLQLPAVSYATSTTDGERSSTLTTAQRPYAWLSVSHDDYLLYYYPLGTVPMISASKLIGNYEVGLDLGSSSLSSSAATGSSNVYGAYVGTFPSLCPSTNLELYLIADRFQAVGDVVDPTFATGTLLKASADLAVPVNKRLTYVGGVNYSTFNQEGTLTRTFGVNVMSLRLSL